MTWLESGRVGLVLTGGECAWKSASVLYFHIRDRRCTIAAAAGSFCCCCGCYCCAFMCHDSFCQSCHAFLHFPITVVYSTWFHLFNQTLYSFYITAAVQQCTCVYSCAQVHAPTRPAALCPSELTVKWPYGCLAVGGVGGVERPSELIISRALFLEQMW